MLVDAAAGDQTITYADLRFGTRSYYRIPDPPRSDPPRKAS
jgi:hypothetical protein